MSYDLAIYAARELAAEELGDLVAAAGLKPSPPAGGSMIVTRGARAVHSFTIELPLRVDPDDLPDGVVAVALDARHLYELHVEGSAAAEVPHAVRFARRLAVAAAGAVFDPQTDQIWSRGRLRDVPKVEAGVVSAVELRWYVHVPTTADAGAAWLQAARRHLPEALPKRYGVFEPLQERLDAGGDAAFAEFVREAKDTVFFAPTTPAVSGSLAGGRTKRGVVASHGLTVLAAALADQRWRAALRGLFMDFAERIDPILATAEVRRRLHWSGRSLSYGGDSEPQAYLARSGRWAGLPPHPTWWAWFGPDYAPLVRDHLPAEQVEERGGRLFHWRSDAPADRDQLAATSAMPWLPGELLARPQRSEWLVILLSPAPRRPASLS